jgi:hypothetical protein
MRPRSVCQCADPNRKPVGFPRAISVAMTVGFPCLVTDTPLALRAFVQEEWRTRAAAGGGP